MKTAVPLYGPNGHDGIDRGLDQERGYITVTAPGVGAPHEIPWGLDGFDHILSRTCPCDPVLERTHCECGGHTVGDLVYRHQLVRE